MVLAIEIFKYFLLIWLAFLALLVLRDILIIHRSMQGIFSTKSSEKINPERVILLLFTIGFALYYSLTTLALPIDELPVANGRRAMPDVSHEVLAALFGAQSSFIVGKILRNRIGKILRT